MLFGGSIREQSRCPGEGSASDSWPAAATMCSMRERCRMHNEGSSSPTLETPGIMWATLSARRSTRGLAWTASRVTYLEVFESPCPIEFDQAETGCTRSRPRLLRR